VATGTFMAYSVGVWSTEGGVECKSIRAKAGGSNGQKLGWSCCGGTASLTEWEYVASGFKMH